MSITSVIRYIQALDSTVTTGAGKAGLAFGDITAKYLTKGGVLTALTTETITTLGTYQAPTSAAHIRIKELNSADPTKGIYEVHFHNTQMAGTGIRLWLFCSATGAVFQPLELDLVPYMDHSAQSAADLKDFADDGYDPSTNKVAGVTGLTFTVANVVDANALRLNGNATSAALLALSALGIYAGTVTGASPTTTTLVDSALGGKATDFYKNRALVSTSLVGTEAKQVAQVTGYNGGTNTLTFTALATALAQNDTYVLL